MKHVFNSVVAPASKNKPSRFYENQRHGLQAHLE